VAEPWFEVRRLGLEPALLDVAQERRLRRGRVVREGAQGLALHDVNQLGKLADLGLEAALASRRAPLVGRAEGFERDGRRVGLALAPKPAYDGAVDGARRCTVD